MQLPTINRRTLLASTAAMAIVSAGSQTLLAPAASATTPLPNPGFEQVSGVGFPSQWALFGKDTTNQIRIVTDRVRSGTNALLIADTSGTGIGVRSTKIDAEAGRHYEATIHALIDSGSFALYLEFWNAAGTRLNAVHTRPSPHERWQKVTVRGIAPAGTAKVSILPYSPVGNKGAVAVFDDAALRPFEPRMPRTHSVASVTAAVRGGTRVGDRVFFTSRHPIEQGAARVGAVNFRTGKLDYCFDIDFGSSSAGCTMTTDGTYVYIGTSGSRYIWRHQPGTSTATPHINLGSSRWVYSMSVHGDHLYFGTYNDGTVRRARLSDGSVDRVYGRVSTSMYATGAAANDQFVFGGSSAPGTLLRWPIGGGEAVDLTRHLSESPVGILDLLVTADTVYVSSGRQVISMGLDGEGRVSRTIAEEDRYVDKLVQAPDGTIYAMARLTTNVYRVDPDRLTRVAKPLDHVENQFLGATEDGTLLGVTGLGHVWWQPKGGEATVFDAATTEFAYPDEVQSMLLHSNGTLWVGGHFSMTVHNLAEGTQRRILINGEPKDLVEGPDGVIYAGMYPSATVIAIDPTSLKVTTLGAIPGQMRTMDMAYDSRRNVVLVGTGPTSKRYDGALTFIDLETGRFEIRQDILPNHRIHGIALDSSTAYVVGDVVGEGNTTPGAPVALVAAVDLGSRNVLWRRALRNDWLSYEDLVLDGKVLYFMSRRPRGEWFSYDLDTGRTVASGVLGGYGSFAYDKGRVYSWVHWANELAELPSRKNPEFCALYTAIPNGWYNNPFLCITPNGKRAWGLWGPHLAEYELTGRGTHGKPAKKGRGRRK